MINNERNPSLVRLDVFLGEWRVEALIPLLQFTPIDGRCEFEWALDGQFLLQRTEVSHPDAPDSLAIISLGTDEDSFIQHYYDARGVVRVYGMSFRENVLTLLRDSPDFSPLLFSQRFTAVFSEDGSTIEGKWEISHDGSSWEDDFHLRYVKVS